MSVFSLFSTVLYSSSAVYLLYLCCIMAVSRLHCACVLAVYLGCVWLCGRGRPPATIAVLYPTCSKFVLHLYQRNVLEHRRDIPSITVSSKKVLMNLPRDSCAMTIFFPIAPHDTTFINIFRRIIQLSLSKHIVVSCHNLSASVCQSIPM